MSTTAPADRRLRLMLQVARMIHRGRLTIVLPDGARHVFDPVPDRKRRSS